MNGAVGAGPDAGIGDILTPTDLPGAVGATEVSMGAQSGCATHADGTVWCWGTISSGQVGIDPSTTDASIQFTAHQIANVSNVVQLSNGWFYFTCALEQTGAVKCWDNNLHGELGRTLNSGIYDWLAAPVAW